MHRVCNVHMLMRKYSEVGFIIPIYSYLDINIYFLMRIFVFFFIFAYNLFVINGVPQVIFIGHEYMIQSCIFLAVQSIS